MPATKLPTTIPLGRVSLASLEYVVDPVLRLLYLRNTLEFVQHYTGAQLSARLHKAVREANAVRNRIEHPRPGGSAPSLKDITSAASVYDHTLRESVARAGPAMQQLMDTKVSHIPTEPYRTPARQKRATKAAREDARRSLARLYRVTRGWEQIAEEFSCPVPGALQPPGSPSGNGQVQTPTAVATCLIPGRASLLSISALTDRVARLFLSTATLQFLLFAETKYPPDAEPELGDMVLARKKLFRRHDHILSACEIRNALVHVKDKTLGLTRADVSFANKTIDAALVQILEVTPKELRRSIVGEALPETDKRFSQFAFDMTRGLVEHKAPSRTNGLLPPEHLYFEQASEQELRTLAKRCVKRLREVVPVVAKTLAALPPPTVPPPTTAERLRAFWKELRRVLFTSKKRKKPKPHRQIVLLEQARFMKGQLKQSPSQRKVPQWAKKKARQK